MQAWDFYGNKQVTDYLKWEIIIKIASYRARKSNTFNSSKVFSNAAWFVINMTRAKQHRSFYI